MTINVSRQRVYIPVTEHGLLISRQRVYIPVTPQGLFVSRQRVYIPIIDANAQEVPAVARRRQISSTF